MIRVHHNSNFLKYLLDSFSIPTDYRRLGHTTLTYVASVDTDDLDEAYRLTNHIETRWTKNPGVHTGIPETDAVRSTSVGDVLDTGSKKYVVESEGFREMTLEEDCGVTWHLPEYQLKKL